MALRTISMDSLKPIPYCAKMVSTRFWPSSLHTSIGSLSSIETNHFCHLMLFVWLIKRAVYCFFVSARITEQTTASLVCAPRRNTMSVQFFFQVPDRLHDETAGRARNVWNIFHKDSHLFFGLIVFFNLCILYRRTDVR